MATGSVVPSVVEAVGDTPVNALRLTNSDRNQRGFVLYDQAISISSGIDITFSQAQFGGSRGADGIAFFAKNAADESTTPGGAGGSLGYSVGARVAASQQASAVPCWESDWMDTATSIRQNRMALTA